MGCVGGARCVCVCVGGGGGIGLHSDYVIYLILLTGLECLL